jgi:hypothetical protein
MTVEERAKTVTDEVGTATTGAELRALIIQALRDQIEDCAKVMDKQATGFQVLIDHAPTPIRGEDLKRVKHSLEVVAKQIRALATPTEQAEGKEG